MAAWPTKNAMNEVISETTRVTVLNTSSFAAYTVPRRGIAVSEVRIIPGGGRPGKGRNGLSPVQVQNPS